MELRLARISGIAAGNAVLPGFVARFNARFAVTPARPPDLHRPLNLAPGRLRLILCRRELRHVGQQLTLSFARRRLLLERNAVTAALAGRHVDLHAFADGRLEVRWQGVFLPCRVFDKDQRVDPAAIVENKRLGELLTFIKRQQDERMSPRLLTKSERGGYRRTGRKPPGRKGIIERLFDERRAMAAGQARPHS